MYSDYSDSDEEWVDKDSNVREMTNNDTPQNFETYYDRSIQEFEGIFTPQSILHSEWFRTGIEISGWEYEINGRLVFKSDPFTYPDIFNCTENYIEKCTIEPDIYKKCTLKIISTEEAICVPLEQEDIEIKISGREKCGQTYSKDIVIVKVLNEGKPVDNQPLYGQVVSFVKRQRFKDVKHPVFICLMAPSQSHFMIPVCKTVPKIKILQNKLKRNWPQQINSRVELYSIDSAKRLCFNKYHKINDGERGNWLFIVVILKWNRSNRYPLGAVLDVVHFSENLQDGLSMISIENELPFLYNYLTIRDTEKLLEETKLPKYEDLSQSLRVFTIDEQDAKDLNHAFSVEKLSSGHVRIGVHVTDVGVSVTKGGNVDNEAQSRGFTYFSGFNLPRNPMLPETISEGLCSLNLNKPRCAISIFHTFYSVDNCQIVKRKISKTIIKSSGQFSFQRVQDMLANSVPMENEDETFSNDIKQLYSLSKNLKLQRLGNASYALPVEVNLLLSSNPMITNKARTIVEEVCILVDNFIGHMLEDRFPGMVPHLQSDVLDMNALIGLKREWYRKYNIYGHIVMTIQNETIPGIGKLSFEGNHNLFDNELSELIVPVDKILYESILDISKYDGIEEVANVISSDKLHPKQGLALFDWMELQLNWKYILSQKLYNSLPSRVHFTTPLRQYSDLVIQRMVDAHLSNSDCPYSVEELETILMDLNSSLMKRNSHHEKCQELILANYIQSKPTFFSAHVSDISISGIHIVIPGIPKKFFVKFKDLEVCDIPEMIGNDDENYRNDPKCNQNKVIAKWNRRIYSFTTKTFEKNAFTFSSLNPHKETTFVAINDWRNILNFALVGSENELKIALMKNTVDIHIRDHITHYQPQEEIIYERERSVNHKRHKRLEEDGLGEEVIYERQKLGKDVQDYVEDINSEVSGDIIMEHECRFQIQFQHGQIVLVQLSAQEIDGTLRPVPQILEFTENVKFCLQHVQDPVKAFLRYSTKHSENYYRNPDLYVETWIPIVEMESTFCAVDSSNSAVLADIPVKFRGKQGKFKLHKTYCEKRDLDFTVMLEEKDSILLDESSTKYQKVLSPDFLCIMLNFESDENTENIFGKYSSKKKQFIWKAHAQIQKVCKYTKAKSEDTDPFLEKIGVVFQIHENDFPPPNQDPVNCRIEVIFKPVVSKRTEYYIKLLKRSSKLARQIALRREIPQPDREHLAVANIIVDEGVDVEEIWRNNDDQHWAIKHSLKSKFHLIQGPPGTGKTYTGVKLIYLFNKFNKLRQERVGGDKSQIMFCGPSNRSVDLVARYVLKELQNDPPKIVRIYGSSYEQITHPIPGKSSSPKRDARIDKELFDSGIVLHFIIREDEKPYAKELKKYDSQFKRDMETIERNRSLPTERRELVKTTMDDIKKYIELLKNARQEELTNYDVIFCTTSLVTSSNIVKATKGRIYQLIVDESGMCTEPETIAIIVATRAKQVVLIGDHKQLRPIIKCKEAANLGLESSLFERYSENRQLKTMLKLQYRMHKRICEFPSSHFYNNELRTGNFQCNTRTLSIWPKDNENLCIPHMFCHVEGKEKALTVKTEDGSEQSRSNEMEIEHVLKIFKYMVEQEKVPPESINIMSQYKAQCSAIQEALRKANFTKYTVSTVVLSQGGEWDYVIFSLVRSLPTYLIQEQPSRGWCIQNLGFITDNNQINVALTRAKNGMILVGNKHLLQCDNMWKELIQDYQRKGCVIDAPDFPPTFADT